MANRKEVLMSLDERTLNAIADTLLERFPEAVESAAMIRRAGKCVTVCTEIEAHLKRGAPAAEGHELRAKLRAVLA